MKALLSTAPGGPETLQLTDLPEPTPEPGEVTVAVHACGVNFPDSLIIRDLYQFKPARPFAPGAEFAGTIKAVGEGVTHLQPGQRVVAFVIFGGMAEVVTVNAERCVPIPEGMPFDDAAALLLTYGTVIHGLKDRADIKPGETLLVLGAAGGIGVASIQLGKAMGARVVAAASSQDKLDLARAMGADETVLYPAGDIDKAASRALADAFKTACGPNGADVVMDPVGGAYAEPALRAIAWEGRYLVVGFPAGIPSIPLNLTLLKGCQIVGVFWGGFLTHNPAGASALMDELMRLYDDGTIRPEISERFPLAQGGQAITRLASRQARGKVIVEVQ
jgi:NADPH:quinone reductase